MYTVGSIFQTTYTTSKTMFPGNTLGQQQLQSGSGKRKKELREQMRLLNGFGNQVSGNHQNNAGNKVFVAQSKSFVETMRDYNEKLQNQRLQTKDTSNQLKKLKYSFKNISGKLMRSKTSTAARQVVGEAKREVLRLKQQKQTGKYDSEEIDAAISHAKAMERVARKKVRHLEEEELAKACGACSDRLEEYQKDLENEWEEQEAGTKEQENAEAEENVTAYTEDGEELSFEAYDYLLAGAESLYAELGSCFENMEVQTAELENLTGEMMDELAESMKDMLSEMGLDELADVFTDVKQDMDPADLKLMKIKHRSKELKEIAKADAEYLKAVFEHLEKQKAGASLPLGNATSSGNSFALPNAVSVAAPAVAGGISESVIDISL